MILAAVAFSFSALLDYSVTSWKTICVATCGEREAMRWRWLALGRGGGGSNDEGGVLMIN